MSNKELNKYLGYAVVVEIGHIADRPVVATGILTRPEGHSPDVFLIALPGNRESGWLTIADDVLSIEFVCSPKDFLEATLSTTKRIAAPPID